MSFTKMTGERAVTAQRVLQSAAMGIMASQENVSAAIDKLNDQGIDKTAAPSSHRTLRFLRMGILPSVLVCEKAIDEINAIQIKNASYLIH